jgi:type II secretory pathway pseudopilin PulG
MRVTPRTAVSPSAAANPAAREDGSSLIEVVVATLLISIVMTSVTSFFVSATLATGRQGGEQTAVQLAADGIEAARDVAPAALLTDPPRDQTSPKRNGITYARTCAVTPCWQPPTGGACGVNGAGFIPFLEVVVTVEWADRRCPAPTCSYSTSTLVSRNLGEPMFTS